MKIYCFHCLCSFGRTQRGLLPNVKNHYYTNQIVRCHHPFAILNETAFYCIHLVLSHFHTRTRTRTCTPFHQLNMIIFDLTCIRNDLFINSVQREFPRKKFEYQNVYRSLSLHGNGRTGSSFGATTFQSIIQFHSMNETNFLRKSFEWCTNICFFFWFHSSLKILRSTSNRHTVSTSVIFKRERNE